MTLKSLIDDAISTLKENKIDDYEHDAIEIMLKLLDMDMARYLYEKDFDLEEKYAINSIRNIISDYNELVNVRASHCPLQYILGETYFCGMKFGVDNDVLIPRADTETLVEKVLMDNPNRSKSVLDICTGSGCIAISLAKLGEYKLVAGSDISEEAIELASKNADEILDGYEFDDELNQRVFFIKSDLFENIAKLDKKYGINKFDIITANPPYIRTSDLRNLQREVRDYEPRLALDGDKDGLKYYKRIAKEAKDYLSKDGKIYLEIGFDQAKDVKDIFENEGWEFIELVKDLGENDRVLVFHL